jgi:hypothetical protein
MRVRPPVLPAVALVASLALGGCDRGGDDGEPEPDPACIENSQTICERACACDISNECSERYPGAGASQTHGSLEECLAAWEGYCGELPEGTMDGERCAADLAAAECVGLGDRDAIDIPPSCHRYPSTAECMGYGSRICDLACACDPAEGCIVQLTPSLRTVLDSWSHCDTRMTGNCDEGLTGVEDYGACMRDLGSAECVNAPEGPALDLPVSCWST